PFAVDREVESYDLTLTQTNRDGQAPDLHDSLLFRTDQVGFYELFSEQQTATIRVPKGTYALYTLQVDFSDDPKAFPPLMFGVQPRLELTADQTVGVDGRLSRPISVPLPHPDQSQVLGDIGATTTTPEGPASAGIAGPNLDGVQSLALGPPDRVDGFNARLAGTWARLDTNGVPDNSPVVYNLAWITEGQMITGATHEVRDQNLARVIADHAMQDTGGFGSK